MGFVAVEHCSVLLYHFDWSYVNIFSQLRHTTLECSVLGINFSNYLEMICCKKDTITVYLIFLVRKCKKQCIQKEGLIHKIDMMYN